MLERFRLTPLSHADHARLTAAFADLTACLDRPGFFGKDFDDNADDVAHAANTVVKTITEVGLLDWLMGNRVENKLDGEDLAALDLLRWAVNEGGYSDGKACVWLEAHKNSCARPGGGKEAFGGMVESLATIVEELLAKVKPVGDPPRPAVELLPPDGIRCRVGEAYGLTPLNYRILSALVRDGDFAPIKLTNAVKLVYAHRLIGDPMEALIRGVSRLTKSLTDNGLPGLIVEIRNGEIVATEIMAVPT